MATNTTNNYFSKPAVGGDTDTWGTTLNANWDAVDSIVTGGTTITRLGIGTTNSTLPLICNAASASDVAASFSGYVGIGTDSPTYNLVVNNAASSAIQIRSGNDDAGHLYFADTDDDNIGGVSYSHEYNFMNFKTNDTERMRIDSNGKVGIGTSSPSYTLDIEADTAQARIHSTVGNSVLRLDSVDDGESKIFFADNSASAIGTIEYHHDSNYMSFDTVATERMRIDSSGNVGIGTDSPDSILDVVGADPILTIRDTSTSGADSHATLRLAESDGSGNVNVRFDVALDEGDLTFDYSNGSTTSERMRIDSLGNVGIGITSPSSKLHVAGDGKFDGGTSTVLDVLCDDGGTADIKAMGGNQGNGRVYVGQSNTYGGGIEYCGNDDPELSGAGSDKIALFRRHDGTNEWTAKNSYNSNDWEFRGKVTADELEGTLVQSIFNQIYPVGAVYISTSSTSPATLFGGTWTAIGGGRVLQTVSGSSPAAGQNYGTNSHTITEANMPVHDHMVARNEIASSTDVTTSAHTIANLRGVDYGGLTNANFEYDLGHATGGRANCGRTSDAGSGIAFNVQQASYGVYMWKRASLA
jgi:hypothetical protein